MTHLPPAGWTTSQIAAYADVSRYHLDRWCRRGLIPGQPTGRTRGNDVGDRRLPDRTFTTEQAEYIRLMARLVRTGFTADGAAKTAGILIARDHDYSPVEVGYGVFVSIIHTPTGGAA